MNHMFQAESSPFDLGRPTTEIPLVTVGIVNCNRLHYLKSCLESFLECTNDYPDKEVIIVDNASVEEGTEEYLNEKKSQGAKIFRMPERDPSNELARALNTIVRESSGKYLVLLQGDMQFIVRGGWLREYVDLYEKSPDIGCITLDAQRRVTIQGSSLSQPVSFSRYKFVADFSRPRTSGAADVMYSRAVLSSLGPWSEKNDQHEYSGDSETKMLQRIETLSNQNPNLNWLTVLPIYPVSVAIYTDSRGTNARIRGDRRYGDYWPPKVGHQYYEIKNFEDVTALEDYRGRQLPYSIEAVTVAVGDWKLPKDEAGMWKKNPIRPEEATPDDWVDLLQTHCEDDKL